MERESLTLQTKQLPNGHRVYTVDVGNIPPHEIKRRINDLKILFRARKAR